MRLGVYADLVYRLDGDVLSTDRSFVNFLAALPPRVEELVLFGRLDPAPGRSHYVVPTGAARLVALPHYESVFAVGEVLRALPASCRTFSNHLDEVDAVWLFGPAPVAVAFALVALRRRKQVFLGVRQDYPAYVRARLPTGRWTWALGAAYALDLAFRLVATRAPTVTVGEDLARRYRSGRAPVLPIGLSLVRSGDVVSRDEALGRSWQDGLRVLSVGRLDPEKNPLLLLDVIEELRRRDPRWRLAVVGDGPLSGELAAERDRRRLGDAVELLGQVPNGPELWNQYRGSHVFLHVSLTEGLPQVLFEAEAAGLPIVATDVGGVAAALGQGSRGLLVPPRDARAAADAIARLAADASLRERLVDAALEHARAEALDVQLDRVAAFFARAVGRR